MGLNKGRHFFFGCITQIFAHTKHNLLLLFIKLNHFQRQRITFFKTILWVLHLFHAQLRRRHKTFHVTVQIYNHATFKQTRHLPIGRVAHRIGDSQLSPRIFNGLFVTQRNATAVFIDIEHHHLKFLALFHNFVRMANALGPRHI